MTLQSESPEEPEPWGIVTSHEHNLGLTTRQIEVACLLVDGLTYAQIATRLTVSEHTVHEHVRHIYARLGCRRSQLIAALVRADLCDQPTK